MKYFLNFEEEFNHLVIRDENGQLKYSIDLIDLDYTQIQIEGKLIIKTVLTEKEIKLNE